MRISFKFKILLLTIIPLVLLSLTISWMYQRQAHELAQQQVGVFEENLMNARREALKDYVALAMDAIQPTLEQLRNGLDQTTGEEQIRDTLRSLRYGSDGYFFAYTPQGMNLVHATQPDLENQLLIDFQDENGQFVIRDLLALARKGGGYYQYMWRKPTDGQAKPKLSYVVTVPRLGWMMGTGLYVDDIAREIAVMQDKVASNARRSFWTATVLLIVTLSMVVLIVTIVNMHTAQLADDRLKQLTNRFVTFQVMQRRNFARELHDGINQLLVSTKLRLNLADKKWPDASAQEHLGKATEQLNIAIQEVRRISHNLRPVLLDDLGLEAAINGLLDELAEGSDILTRRRIRLGQQRLPDAIEMTIYRVVQEAVTNIRKHADATQVVLNLYMTGKAVHLKMGDNGCGFSPDTDFSGIGIMNMQERVELLGGSFTVRNRPRGGTLIHAEFQLNPDPALNRE